MIRSLLRAAFCLMLFCGIAAAQTKNAVDPDLPAADPKNEWRDIHQTGPLPACTGDLSRPVCAVHMMMACLARAGDYCRMVIAPNPPLDANGRPHGPDHVETAESFAGMTPPPTRFQRYRIAGSKRVRGEADMWIHGYNVVRLPREIGDVVISVQWMACYRRDKDNFCTRPMNSDNPVNSPTEYTLRRQSDGAWRVVDWYTIERG